LEEIKTCFVLWLVVEEGYQLLSKSALEKRMIHLQSFITLGNQPHNCLIEPPKELPMKMKCKTYFLVFLHLL
jgi:hypothetical protein